MIEARYYVYEWFIIETGEVFYVGKGSKNRVTSMKDRNKYFKDIRNKYECDYRILKYFSDEEEAYDYELKRGLELKSIGQARACYMLGNAKRYIDFSVKQKTKKTNFKKGHKPANYGKKMSDEFRENCRQRNLGTKQSEETKRKRSEALKGHSVSENVISTLVENRRKPVYKINPNTNEIEKEYFSAKSVADEYNVSPATITVKCKSQKVWNGYIFTYVKQGNPEGV